MDISTDARATAARLDFERTVTRVERVDPATSARARLRGLALTRELRARRRPPASYAAELESLTDELHRALEPGSGGGTSASATPASVLT